MIKFTHHLLGLVHPETGEVFEYDIIFFLVGVKRVLVAMSFDGLHLLHRIEALTFNRSCELEQVLFYIQKSNLIRIP